MPGVNLAMGCAGLSVNQWIVCILVGGSGVWRLRSISSTVISITDTCGARGREVRRGPESGRGGRRDGDRKRD